MQIATVTQFASKLTEKGATRSSVMVRKRMPSGSTELKEMIQVPAKDKVFPALIYHDRCMPKSSRVRDLIRR